MSKLLATILQKELRENINLLALNLIHGTERVINWISEKVIVVEVSSLTYKIGIGYDLVKKASHSQVLAIIEFLTCFNRDMKMFFEHKNEHPPFFSFDGNMEESFAKELKEQIRTMADNLRRFQDIDTVKGLIVVEGRGTRENGRYNFSIASIRKRLMKLTYLDQIMTILEFFTEMNFVMRKLEAPAKGLDIAFKNLDDADKNFGSK